MTKLSRKSILFTAVGVILVGGSVATAIALTNLKPDAKPSNKSSASGSKSSTTTVSPASILSSTSTYAGQELTVTGRVVQQGVGGSKSYYVVSQEKETSSAIKLDFSGSGIDPTTYADVPPETGQPGQRIVPKGPYKVIGTLNKPGKAQAPLLTVRAIEEQK